MHKGKRTDSTEEASQTKQKRKVCRTENETCDYVKVETCEVEEKDLYQTDDNIILESVDNEIFESEGREIFEVLHLDHDGESFIIEME